MRDSVGKMDDYVISRIIHCLFHSSSIPVDNNIIFYGFTNTTNHKQHSKMLSSDNSKHEVLFPVNVKYEEADTSMTQKTEDLLGFQQLQHNNQQKIEVSILFRSL